MYKYLFFDDQKLHMQNGFYRCYGQPQLISDSVYSDGHSSTDWRTAFVFQTEDEKYRMLYQGREVDGSDHCFIAVSEDGIHFEPEDLSEVLPMENRVAVNEVFSLRGEIAEIVEDNVNDSSERYKMLCCEAPNEELYVNGTLLTSPDLIHWTQVEGVSWNGGAEPITGVFYNKQRECFTIMVRPYWGVRRVGYVETKDWRHYTPFQLCMQADSLDKPLEEIYGMPSFAYEGRYIGYPLIYTDFKPTNNAKYYGGTIKPQLAYSWDGIHWQRSLREPFMDGMTETCEEAFGWKNYLLWPSCITLSEDGSIRIYASVSGCEHGSAFTNSRKGRIGVWQLRNDGFIALSTAYPKSPATLATRENIWHSGEVHVNLQASKATLAVYETRDADCLGEAHALDGYSHEDCIPFSGDSTDWVPCFKNGKAIAELSGKTIVLELKIEDGSVYSISGDMTPIMNTEAARYRILGRMPQSVI